MSSPEFLQPRAALLSHRSSEIQPQDLGLEVVQATIEQTLAIARGERSGDETKNYMVGLAAPQLGIMKRIIVVDRFVEASQLAAEYDGLHEVVPYINPRIVWASDEMEEFREGCYSLGANKGIYGVVSRHSRVTVEAIMRDGRPFRETLSGLQARIFQHEEDHLNGLLYLHRMPIGSVLHTVSPEQLAVYKDGGWRDWPHHISVQEALAS